MVMKSDCSVNTYELDLDAWQSGQGPDAAISLEGTPFAGYWEDLPSLIIPKPTGSSSTFDEDGGKDHPITLAVDGYSFRGRMSVYRFLIFLADGEQHSVSLWQRSTSLREFHWLWAYAAQLDWQHRSGRLSSLVTAKEPTQDTSTKTTPHPDRIDVNSWWGYMNFSFSVAILLALEKTGWLSETLGGEKKTPVLIQLDPVSQELVDNDVCVQKCIAAWENMFRHAYAEYRSIILGNREISQKEYLNARFHLQKEVWKAHTAVIDGCDGGERYEALVSQMPMPEELFARGWARMVSILAAACFPMDLITLKKDGAGFLPLQIISNSTWQEWQAQAEQLTGVPK